MINAEMRSYSYYAYKNSDEYGQPQLAKDASGELEVQGSIKIAIFTSSQSVQDNINYLNCQYVGITLDSSINDTLVIKYGEELLKVLYVSKQGRYMRAYLQKVK